MGIKVALEHRTSYTFDRLVEGTVTLVSVGDLGGFVG